LTATGSSRRSFLRGAGLIIAGTTAAITGMPRVADAASTMWPSGSPTPPLSAVPQSAGRIAFNASGVAAAGSQTALEFLDGRTGAVSQPLVRARVRLIGDMHFGFASRDRLAAVADDVATMGAPDAFLTTGDETHFGLQEEYDLAEAWFSRFKVPMHTVTGNHTFWNASSRTMEDAADLYRRFVIRWGQPMPFAWEMAGVSFVGVGPTTMGVTPQEASLSVAEIAHMGKVLSYEPTKPTVLVMHSPLQHTVLGDDLGATCSYTSEDTGFYQRNTAAILDVLGANPQVAMVISGHTHSPLHATGLYKMVSVGDRMVPHFNAMAVPFLRRITATGPTGPQSLVTWELGIGDRSIVLVGRDHLLRRDVARVVVPLPALQAAPSPVSPNLTLPPIV